MKRLGTEWKIFVLIQLIQDLYKELSKFKQRWTSLEGRGEESTCQWESLIPGPGKRSQLSSVPPLLSLCSRALGATTTEAQWPRARTAQEKPPQAGSPSTFPGNQHSKESQHSHNQSTSKSHKKEFKTRQSKQLQNQKWEKI